MADAGATSAVEGDFSLAAALAVRAVLELDAADTADHLGEVFLHGGISKPNGQVLTFSKAAQRSPFAAAKKNWRGPSAPGKRPAAEQDPMCWQTGVFSGTASLFQVHIKPRRPAGATSVILGKGGLVLGPCAKTRSVNRSFTTRADRPLSISFRRDPRRTQIVSACPGR